MRWPCIRPLATMGIRWFRFKRFHRGDAFGFCITIFAGCAGLKGWSLAGSAGFHGLNTGTPDGGGLGFLLKLLLTAESFGNGFEYGE